MSPPHTLLPAGTGQINTLPAVAQHMPVFRTRARRRLHRCFISDGYHRSCNHGCTTRVLQEDPLDKRAKIGIAVAAALLMLGAGGFGISQAVSGDNDGDNDLVTGPAAEQARVPPSRRFPAVRPVRWNGKTTKATPPTG